MITSAIARSAASARPAFSKQASFGRLGQSTQDAAFAPPFNSSVLALRATICREGAVLADAWGDLSAGKLVAVRALEIALGGALVWACREQGTRLAATARHGGSSTPRLAAVESIALVRGCHQPPLASVRNATKIRPIDSPPRVLGTEEPWPLAVQSQGVARDRSVRCRVVYCLAHCTREVCSSGLAGRSSEDAEGHPFSRHPLTLSLAGQGHLAE